MARIPDRDGDFDHEVVLHEYTHGLSNRRVGGGVGISALQPRGMGEGWSDWYAMSLLSEPADDVNAVYAAGGVCHLPVERTDPKLLLRHSALSVLHGHDAKIH